LIDMNLAPRWVDDLKAAGIESVHWSAIIRALKHLAPELAAGALISVDPGRTRVTMLPLGGVREDDDDPAKG
jgi:hypothetical protein